MDERLRFVRQVARWGIDDRCLPGVWRLPQDRLQDLHPLQGSRCRGVVRSFAPSRALCQPTAKPDREFDRHFQTREAPLGCSQDSGAAGSRIGRRRAHPGQEHHSRRFISARSGQGDSPPSSAGQRNTAVRRRRAQRSVVRRLQGALRSSRARGERSGGKCTHRFSSTGGTHASTIACDRPDPKPQVRSDYAESLIAW